MLEKFFLLVIFADLVLYPLGSTIYFDRTLLFYFTLSIAFLRLTTCQFRVDTGLEWYCRVYSFGLGWLLCTAVISGELERPRVVLGMMAGVAATLWTVSTFPRDLKIVKVVLLAMIVTSFIYAGLIYTNLGISGFTLEGAKSGLNRALIDEENFIGNKNNVGKIYFFGFAAAALGFSAEIFRGRKWIVILAVLFGLVLATVSVRSIVAATICAGVLVDFRSSYRYRTIGLLGLASGILIAVLYYQTAVLEVASAKVLGVLGIEFLVSELDDSEYGVRGALNRQGLVVSVFNIFLDNPIIGVGIENTRLTLGTFSHFDFVELLAGGGLIAPFFFYYGYAKVMSIATTYHYDSRIGGVRAIFFLVSILSLGISGGIYHERMVHVLLIIALLVVFDRSAYDCGRRR